jgi:uncharacterized protein YbcI
MLYLSNAFSLNMLSSNATLKVSEVADEKVKELLSSDEFTSAVGHQSTADIMKDLIGVEVPANRVAIKLQKGDAILIFQLLVRIEEGKILSKEELQKLPRKWYLVEVL